MKKHPDDRKQIRKNNIICQKTQVKNNVHIKCVFWFVIQHKRLQNSLNLTKNQ